LNQPDPAYHGAVWTEAVKPMGPVAYIIKMRVTLLRDLGAAASPFNSFLHIQGLETLPLRMRVHCANATAVARALRSHPKVSKIIYPGVMEGEPRRRADAYMKGGYGGLLGFELKGGKDAGRRFIDALKMFYHVANIGDARSLAIHPASTTHSQLTPEEQLQTGVTDGYVRLDLGLTVASHGWVHLDPWRWDSTTGTLSHTERVGGDLGTLSVRQREPQVLAVGWEGFADEAAPELLRRAARWVSADWDPAPALA